MTQKEFDVVGVGCVAVDYLGIIPRFPRMDEKLWMEEFTRQGGGMVGTALVTLSRLGAKTCYVGKIGDDEFGRFVIEEFEKENVDTSRIITAPGGSARVAFIYVDKQTGKRTILIPKRPIPTMTPADVLKDHIAAARILHTDGLEIDSAVQAARYAKEAGMTVVLDGEVHHDRMRDILPFCDVIIGSEDFGRTISGRDDHVQAAEAIFAEQRKLSPDKVVVITLGERGAYCISKDGAFHTPAFKVEVVDTTGCGDVYHGAFVYGLLQGWNLPRIARFAAAVAALKCRALGGRAGIPTLREVEEFLDSNPPVIT